MRTTPKHFAQFKRSVNKWLANFGLVSWEVVCLHKELQEPRLAECGTDPVGNFADLTLGTAWGNLPCTSASLDQTACHEVLHILLAKLTTIAGERWVTERELENGEHAVIRALLQFLFPKLKA